MPFSLFLSELNTLIFLAASTTPRQFLITGDFNLHLDHPEAWAAETGEQGDTCSPSFQGAGARNTKCLPHFLVIIILFFIAVLKWTILIKYIV